MTTNTDPMARSLVGAVGGFKGDSALRNAPKKVMTPHTRFFWWFSLSLLLLGPFGFIVGPLMARRGLRKAERLHPHQAYEARRRDQGFSWGQWWVLTPLVATMGLGALALLKWLPLALIVTWVQLTA